MAHVMTNPKNSLKLNSKNIGILHKYFTLFEAKRRFVKPSSKKCKLLLWGYGRCQNIHKILLLTLY